MNQKKDLPKLVVFAFITLLTAFSWVGFEVYRTLTDAPDPVVPPEVILDLDPTLDQVTLESLVSKVYLEESEIGDTVLSDPNAIEESLIEDIISEEQEAATDSGIIVSE